MIEKMKITHEITEKEHQQFCFDFQDQHNFLLLGRGVFSNVYGANKNSSVYKIGLVDTDVENDPYLSYLYKIKNEKNPFFPKVHNLTIFKSTVSSFYMVEMEKLYPCKEHSLNDQSYDIRENLLSLFECRNHDFSQKEWQSMIHLYKKYGNKEAENLFITLASLLENFKNDIHKDNMMMRKNGQLVITDPFCPKHMETRPNIKY